MLGFLETKDAKAAIEEYIKRYNELLAKSTYFSKGTFEYYNATTIAKSLADNGFFDAKHTVSLNADKKVEISSRKQLEELIEKEREQITKDKSLREKFAKIEKLITKNVSVRKLQAYLVKNEAILSKLANIEEFREDIWKSYMKAQIELYEDLVNKYQAADARKGEIIAEAGKQRTEWEEVIDIFNDRFFVPFKLTAKNRIQVMLGDETILSLEFTFEDGTDTATVERNALLKTLSTGEKKAFYLLNIIFEIQARRKAKQETLFIVDDIATSFDYRNKYAIIQYLKEIADEPYFTQIIMTHNFDFFRTINSRFVGYSHCLMTSKSDSGLILEQAVGIKNIFVKDWKPNFISDPRKKIASIPFMRNLIEYTKGDQGDDYNILTSLLHWKKDTSDITQETLDGIYNTLFNMTEQSDDGNKPMIDIIYGEAQSCLTAPAGINLENKIVLSIAIRLAAEQFMVKKINDPKFVDSIDSVQTPKLMEKFKIQFPGEINNINVIEGVLLMTPENIHLNSFMYEPIVDMSDEHLRQLYQRVMTLE